MVKRLEDEKKRAEGLDAQVREANSKLARAQRQLYLVRNPNGEPAEEENADYSDKPKPMHVPAF